MNPKHLLSTIFTGLSVSALTLFASCSEDGDSCSGKGTLRLENTSTGTVQRAMVDGVNHGSLDPGESVEIELGAGQHIFVFEGISGGNGCSQGTVVIVECETDGFTCSS